MNIIRVFPRRTALTPKDDYAFVGDPPLIRPEGDKVHVSCTFTWDIPEAKRLAAAWAQYYPVRIGGPAIDGKAHGFTPGQYVRDGVTFTSRGCNNQCPWCVVAEREGKLRESRDFTAGNIIQDNNLLQCTRLHIQRVLRMLKGQRQIQFSGGLDTQHLSQAVADQLRDLRMHQVFLACDTDSGIKPLRVAIKRLGLPREKVRCYVLLAFGGQTISQAIARLEDVWDAGAMPFAQLYQPPKWIDYSLDWRRIARQWSRPAIMKTMHKVYTPLTEIDEELI